MRSKGPSLDASVTPTIQGGFGPDSRRSAATDDYQRKNQRLEADLKKVSQIISDGNITPDALVFTFFQLAANGNINQNREPEALAATNALLFHKELEKNIDFEPYLLAACTWVYQRIISSSDKIETLNRFISGVNPHRQNNELLEQFSQALTKLGESLKA